MKPVQPSTSISSSGRSTSGRRRLDQLPQPPLVDDLGSGVDDELAFQESWFGLASRSRASKRRRFGWKLLIESYEGQYVGSYSGRKWLPGGRIGFVDGTRVDLPRSFNRRWKLQATRNESGEVRTAAAAARPDPGVGVDTDEVAAAEVAAAAASSAEGLRESRVRHYLPSRRGLPTSVVCRLPTLPGGAGSAKRAAPTRARMRRRRRVAAGLACGAAGPRHLRARGSVVRVAEASPAAAGGDDQARQQTRRAVRPRRGRQRPRRSVAPPPASAPPSPPPLNPPTS